MLKKIPKDSMYLSNHGWLKSRFHFSFAEYRNINNVNFGVLRVLNDDIIEPVSGFDFHPHNNMEIITYVIDGELTHKDSMGNSEVLKRGEVQYLSAGDGIYHSEHNMHKSKNLRLLQIWIIPPQNSLPRLYGSCKYKQEERKDKFLKIVSSENGNSKIKIYQDINIFVNEMSKGTNSLFKIENNRQIYFVQIEGSSNINEILLEEGDALEILDIEKIDIKAISNSHFLFIEMAKN